MILKPGTYILVLYGTGFRETRIVSILHFVVFVKLCAGPLTNHCSSFQEFSTNSADPSELTCPFIITFQFKVPHVLQPPKDFNHQTDDGSELSEVSLIERGYSALTDRFLD